MYLQHSVAPTVEPNVLFFVREVRSFILQLKGWHFGYCWILFVSDPQRVSVAAARLIAGHKPEAGHMV
jgi:hypothetical protein